MTTARERIYLRHMGLTRLDETEFMDWMTRVLSTARINKQLFTPNGKVKDEAKFIDWLRKTYPARKA